MKRHSLFKQSMAATLAMLIAATPTVHAASNEQAPVADTYTFSESSPAPQSASQAPATQNAANVKRTAPISNSGSFSTSVAIDLPPGRNGMTPQLAFTYNSEAFRTATILGAGWTLGLPSISRSVKEGFPPLTLGPNQQRVYADEGSGPQYRFVSPFGELVPTTDGPTGATGRLFMPLREHSPVRYEYIAGDPSKNELSRWIEHLPNGSKRFYGTSTAQENTSDRVLNALGTHTWLLVKEEDPLGNYITYEYAHAGAAPDEHDCRPYPLIHRVSWGGNSVANIQHMYFATFKATPYAGPRDMLNGHVTYEDMIQNVVVSGPNVNGVTTQYWTYSVTYTDSPASGRKLVSAITRTAPSEPNARAWNFQYTGADSLQWGPAQLLPNERSFFQDGNIKDQITTTTPQDQSDTDKELTYLRRGTLHFRSATKFIDIDGDSRLDAIYHPAGTALPTMGIVPEQSFLGASGFRVGPVESPRSLRE